MKNRKYISFLFFFLLGCTIIGIVLEYVRIKKTYLHYISYETQVETGLIARFAKSCLEQNDLNKFIEFCEQSTRYSLKNNGTEFSESKAEYSTSRPAEPKKSIKELSKSDIDKKRGIDKKKVSIFTPPDKMGLLSRITLFDAAGKVWYDSWKDAETMENHSERPEFRVMMNFSDNEPSFYSFERYSTTIQKKMFFCITKFEVNGDTYLLRTGNIVQSINLAGSEYRQNLLKYSFFFVLVILLLSLLFFSKIQYYRNKLLEIGEGFEDGFLQSGSPRLRKKKLSVDRIINTIQGKIDYQDDLLHQERLLRDSIFQSLAEGVILLDKSGNILDMNDGARRLLDLKRRGYQGLSVFGLWRSSELREMFLQNNWDESGELTLQKELSADIPSGARCLDVRMRRIRWGKSSSGCLLLLYDLTRIRRLESYRKEFVSNVSHEIKTPLTVIMGTVEVLRDGALNDQKAAMSFLETLDIHAKRLYTLVQDVLSLSNLETETNAATERFESISLLDPIEIAVSLCRPLANEHRITIVLENKTDSEPVLPMNAALIEQAFVNLIDNAIKYSADIDKNTFDVSDNSVFDKKVVIRLSSTKGKEIVVEVIDEGPGIPLKHQERIFERFYRVDESRSHQTGGTGLGLAIVKHIVLLHRGEISVKNNPDQGCAFTLRFPASSEETP